MTDLFEPLQIGAITAPNRVFMAPLTRGRAGESRVPNDLMVEYYTQRAGAGLIISEATAISPMGYGWPNAPAIYTDAHEEGWKKVTGAVHKAGGRIYLQLWHMGRVSHPDYHDGAPPVAPSAVRPAGEARTPAGKKPFVEPRPLSVDEIKETVQDYRKAAERAKRAGFDGVEIHGANGYLIDQFLRDNTNLRTDEYGGSVDNRARFLREVIEAVSEIFEPGRIAVRLSPVNDYNDMHDSDLLGHFTRFAEILNDYELSYLHVKEPVADGSGNFTPPIVTQSMRKAYRGVLVANQGYTRETARKALDGQEGWADAIAFGIPYIANPDLAERLKENAPLNKPHPETFYEGGLEGYTDYPFLKDKAA